MKNLYLEQSEPESVLASKELHKLARIQGFKDWVDWNSSQTGEDAGLSSSEPHKALYRVTRKYDKIIRKRKGENS